MFVLFTRSTWAGVVTSDFLPVTDERLLLLRHDRRVVLRLGFGLSEVGKLCVLILDVPG
jgi:hypothetical protein